VLWTLLTLACTRDVPAPVAEEPPADGPETVVLVIGCTLRADRTSVYGNARDTTPYLQQLADQGAVFDEMLSSAPWTRPAIASLISGRHPSELGIDDERDLMNTNRGLHPDWETVAEAMTDAGYTTVGATANPNANAYFNMTQGFESYHEATGLWREDKRKVSGDELLDAWLEQARSVEGKLYGQLVIVDTHSPLPKEARRPTGFGMDVMLNPTQLDKYDAALGVFDEVLAKLDRELAAMGREDRVLMVVGDHGEGLSTPEWAGKAHGRFLYDANLAVPWVVHGPGVQPQRVSGLASSIDVKPTLLGLALASGAGGPGSDHSAVLRDGTAVTGTQEVFSETYFAMDHRARLTTPTDVYLRTYSSLTDEGRGERELYDRITDPTQSRDLSTGDPDRSAVLENDMERIRREIRASRKTYEVDTQVDDELREQLEQLGYVDR
jgi:arylsulfatase A-like enzyme